MNQVDLISSQVTENFRTDLWTVSQGYCKDPFRLSCWGNAVPSIPNGFNENKGTCKHGCHGALERPALYNPKEDRILNTNGVAMGSAEFVAK